MAHFSGRKIQKSVRITPVSPLIPTAPVSLVIPTAPVSLVIPTAPVSLVIPTAPVFSVTPVSSVTPVTVFQAARDRVSEEIGSIVECLNNKRTELFEEIASLEREFSDKQKEKQKDITKLNTLISQTEELGQNTLLKIQQEMIHMIQQKMENLKLECKEPDYKIEIKWGLKKQQLVEGINKSSIQTVNSLPATYSDDIEVEDELCLTAPPLEQETDIMPTLSDSDIIIPFSEPDFGSEEVPEELPFIGENSVLPNYYSPRKF